MMNASPAPQTDNPCWGGPAPQQHSLGHLLNVLAETAAPLTSASGYSSFIEKIHQKLVLFQDDNYLVINKPADLRMDGDYAATMHKVLLFLFPSPSLLTDGISSLRDPEHHRMLLEKIALLSNHSCLKDDPFRIVHQLDYATSGVLIYAKNKNAASTACKSFQERQTNKQYVAVIVNPSQNTTKTAESYPLGSKFLESIPLLCPSYLSQWSDGSLENSYRKKRKRETDERASKKTFDGFMPVHSVFAKWRGSLLRLKKESGDANEKKKSKPRRTKHTDELPLLPEPEVPLTTEEIDEVLSYGQSWKSIKNNKQKHSRCWVTVVETMAREYNRSLEKFYANKEQSEANNSTSDEKRSHSVTLPPLFRVKSEGEVTDDSFYICASIGEPKDGRFEVLVDPSACKVPINTNESRTSEPLPEMRPSLTRCTVLWRGHIKMDDADITSIPVTKVLLKPWTGRRHQLRVHLAHVAGFPILGDVAYGGNIKVKHKNGGLQDDRVACPRMCLHARQLAIPLLGGKQHTFEAPDPFTVVSDADNQNETLEVLC